MGSRERERGGAKEGVVPARHCFTVDENLICTTERDSWRWKLAGRWKTEREREKERKRDRSGKGGRGTEERRWRVAPWVLPCLSVGGGCQIELPPGFTVPGDVCWSAGASTSRLYHPGLVVDGVLSACTPFHGL